MAQKAYNPEPITEENVKKRNIAYIWYRGAGLYLTALCAARPSVKFVYTIQNQIPPICHPSPTSMILK